MNIGYYVFSFVESSYHKFYQKRRYLKYGVDIAINSKIYNEAHLYNIFKKKVTEYFGLEKETRAANCILCSKCENVCPQKLKIIKLLKNVAKYFEST